MVIRTGKDTGIPLTIKLIGKSLGLAKCGHLREMVTLSQC